MFVYWDFVCFDFDVVWFGGCIVVEFGLVVG